MFCYLYWAWCGFHEACSIVIVVVEILSPCSIHVWIVFFSCNSVTVTLQHVYFMVLSFIGINLCFKFNSSFSLHLLSFPLYVIINNCTKSLDYWLFKLRRLCASCTSVFSFPCLVCIRIRNLNCFLLSPAHICCCLSDLDHGFVVGIIDSRDFKVLET